MHADFLDAAVLHVLEQDPHSEDDTGFAFRFRGLKWLASAPSRGKLVHKRDLCWYEELGRTQDANGDELGYLVMQSVRLDECPPFEQQGLTRSTAAVCYVFRPLPNNLVAVYMKGQHAVGGKARTWSADAVMAELWLGVANTLECTKAKRLSKLVSGKEMFVTNAHYFFCKPCLSDAKEKLYGRGATRVSFHSEDSSGRSGSNRSGSPRYARAASTGRQGLSIMSSSSDPTPGQRQRMPSLEHVGSATMPSCRARPSSDAASYTSVRATVSSDPSMSFCSTSSINGSGFNHINDNFSSSSNVQSMRAYHPPPSRPPGRSVENRAAANLFKVQRSGSDTLRPNTAPKAYMSSGTPATILQDSYGNRYVGNQSVDSTYDVDGNETYRGHGYISDDSEMSGESSGEEEMQDLSHSNRGRHLINIYDVDDGGVIEVDRSSNSSSDPSTEPEPVDVFEQDKLKYINSFRTNESGITGSSGDTTASSNGLSDQENLMERLMQINMAAEATYLMTKYNSSICGNAST
ncbi:unnamed protein product [Phytophthora fragariaefolia]|uniref:Unnamed protein product n=1 Tax=Phytophthora fragariaefolia TaxID=1490495 RepID=A0A9W6TTQ2_9STRA|nr:unnamed protein product [Phytophthora fragariaefolia]